MPWLPLYLARTDAVLLLEHLNQDDEVAFLACKDPTDWKAVMTLPSLPDGDYPLWHVQGDPLPILIESRDRAAEFIARSGWLERSPDVQGPHPPFAISDPRCITLNVRTSAGGDVIGISGFQWIGDRYKSLGDPAPAATHRWWNRLKRWVSKNGRKIPRRGPVDGPGAEIWAFPSAADAVSRGTARALNP